MEIDQFYVPGEGEREGVKAALAVCTLDTGAAEVLDKCYSWIHVCWIPATVSLRYSS